MKAKPSIPKRNTEKSEDLSEKLGALKNPPSFVRTNLQHHYYHEVFKQVKDNGTVLNLVDSTGLGMLAINLATVDECMESIDENGVHMEVQGDRNTVTKKNPAVDLLDKAQANIRFYLREYKMTPNSRGKAAGGIPGTKPPVSDGFDEL